MRKLKYLPKLLPDDIKIKILEINSAELIQKYIRLYFYRKYGMYWREIINNKLKDNKLKSIRNQYFNLLWYDKLEDYEYL